MDPTLLAAVLGGVGGLTRGFIGLLKALSLRRKILAGYAGTDILEGIYKSFNVQKVYVKKK
jgi:hypothetical protein